MKPNKPSLTSIVSQRILDLDLNNMQLLRHFGAGRNNVVKGSIEGGYPFILRELGLDEQGLHKETPAWVAEVKAYNYNKLFEVAPQSQRVTGEALVGFSLALESCSVLLHLKTIDFGRPPLSFSDSSFNSLVNNEPPTREMASRMVTGFREMVHKRKIGAQAEGLVKDFIALAQNELSGHGRKQGELEALMIRYQKVISHPEYHEAGMKMVEGKQLMADRLRARMVVMNINPEALAEKLGVRPYIARRWLNGRFSDDTYQKLCTALDIENGSESSWVSGIQKAQETLSVDMPNRVR